jgi:hypothetical protein
MNRLILYHTLGCHLCELAKEEVEPLLSVCKLQLVEIDIADDDILLQRYGVRIPVIRLYVDVNSNKEGDDLGWPFDTEGVYQWLLTQQ